MSDRARSGASQQRNSAEVGKADELFRLVFEGAPNGSVMVGGDGRILLVNKATERLFQYAREELLGQSVEMLVSEATREVHPFHRRDFAAAPETRPMGKGRDLMARRKDGSIFPVEIGLNPLETPDGITTLATVVDISQREAAEREAREWEQRFRDIAEHSPGVLFRRVTYPDGRIEYPFMSKEAEEVFALPFAWTQQVRTVDDLVALVDPDDLQSLLPKLREAERDLTPLEIEGRVHGADDKVRWVRSVSTPRRRQDGAVVWDGLLLDVTRHKETELALRAAHDRLNLLFREISHRVMNGFQIMRAMLMWQRQGVQDREASEALEKAAARVNAMALVHRRLYQDDDKLGVLELSDFLEGVCQDLREAFISADEGQSLTLQAEPGRLSRDRAVALGLMLSELVMNSCKHGHARRTPLNILVEWRRDGERHRLIVSDDGVGLPENFEPERSQGLGMLVIRSQVDQLGGRFSFGRRAGGGARFVADFPALDA